MDGVVEIITGRERRRRWSVQDKLRLIAEMAEPGMRVRAVAARHGVCESLLFSWRRQVRDGVLVAAELPVFMPVQMLGTPLGVPGLSRPKPTSPVLPPAPARPQAGLIEIELGVHGPEVIATRGRLQSPPELDFGLFRLGSKQLR